MVILKEFLNTGIFIIHKKEKSYCDHFVSEETEFQKDKTPYAQTAGRQS